MEAFQNGGKLKQDLVTEIIHYIYMFLFSISLLGSFHDPSVIHLISQTHTH